ncbi:hypothetical protein METBIDRAFT_103101 [Metschnikowia bicuspidata var. bicuspidata NRRL YB-4993]|uniref:PCI domain-containing protein n=1 Tax=Metschnikowia bicuspidata var. bicuspidata NRRL YB-4993 TaxID=869754 RepID=A0A1A0HHE5_9ASCO|nr:hypothetical protein METBIDRAFT_103101 [Metschnikowia bicuspidata var. bicuspidata NRRL YB-4993]OBA23263.1 hypothetical protein METBIDRAFT_103101 [Metschnikowia bicuspidata var. bicuspidata NRRL YB-4993]
MQHRTHEPQAGPQPSLQSLPNSCDDNEMLLADRPVKPGFFPFSIHPMRKKKEGVARHCLLTGPADFSRGLVNFSRGPADFSSGPVNFSMALRIPARPCQHHARNEFQTIQITDNNSDTRRSGPQASTLTKKPGPSLPTLPAGLAVLTLMSGSRGRVFFARAARVMPGHQCAHSSLSAAAQSILEPQNPLVPASSTSRLCSEIHSAPSKRKRPTPVHRPLPIPPSSPTPNALPHLPPDALYHLPSMSLYEYIQEFSGAVAQENGAKLKRLLTINPAHGEGPKRARFSEPSEIDLYPLAEKFQPVVRCYLTAMRSIYISSDIHASLFNLNDLVVALNRAAETQLKWICAALINCSDELISLFQVRAQQSSARQDDEAKAAVSESLELIAATINRSFKICLTDKTLDLAVSKKNSIHFFLAVLIKIYFKLHKLELAKSMEKALTGTGLALPTIVNSPVEYRRHIVTYLYFSSLLSLDESEFAFAEAKLLTAMQFLSCYKAPAKVAAQAEKILLLLVPLKLYNSRTTLPASTSDTFKKVGLVYTQGLFRAVQTGNLREFDDCVRKFQKFFLKRHIYLLAVHLKTLCYLRLIQRTVRLFAELKTPSPHIVPLSAIQLAIEFSSNHTQKTDGSLAAPESLATQNYSVSTEEVECILANLIHKKWVKGYISHSNRCIVLLKTDAFPSI